MTRPSHVGADGGDGTKEKAPMNPDESNPKPKLEALRGLRLLAELDEPKAERAAVAVRRLAQTLVKHEPDEDLLDRIGEAAETLAGELEARPIRPRRSGFGERASKSDRLGYLAYGPIMGRLNPIAPPVRLDDAGGHLAGKVTFTESHEGLPGYVHGGVVAATFDELLGFTQAFSGTPGVTGMLSIRYRAPTPINRTLSLEGHYERKVGRTMHATRKLMDGSTVTAEAEGVFVALGDEKYKEMVRDG